MSYELDPIVGQWYRQIDEGELFRVVGIDEDEDLIEIQYADGESEELDSESWFELDLELSEAPDDWKDPDEGDEDDDEDLDDAELEDDEDDEDADWDEDEDGDDDDAYDDR